ncbi:MAG: hypothetical protein IJZ72_04550 [Oscillospiraceae bacterium]|nr:hypothetical protein [Oscillospiraceae bacterium]
MNKPIIDLMDDKISQLERYNEVTAQIISEDIDSVGDLIAERQRIITAMDGISMDIKEFISNQSIERRDTLDRLMHFEEIGELNGEMLEVQDKIRRIKALREEIMRNDDRAMGRLRKERDELKAKLEGTAKSKQVVNYFSQSTVDVTKGSRFNTSN